MRSRVASLALVAACGSEHVQFPAPPATLTSEQRIDLFQHLHGAYELQEQRVVCGSASGAVHCSTEKRRTLQLADGTIVTYPEDLLPLVRDDSPTAQSARTARSARSGELVWGAGGLAAVIAGGVIYGATTLDALGGGLFFGGLVIGALGMFIESGRATEYTSRAFYRFTDDFASRLDICIVAGTPTPCEQTKP